MRLVTLTCSNTEIACALGLGDAIVGVDDHSDFPEEVVARAARCGPDLGVDPKKVAALRPDLVLASLTVPGHDEVVEGIEREGLPVLVLDPISLEDVYESIRTIAEACGVASRGEALVREMREAIPTWGECRHGALRERPKVLVEWWPKPVYSPGRDSWVTDLVEAAGGINPVGDKDVRSAPVTDEEVQALRPDAVVISWCGVPTAKYRPDVVHRREGWQGVPALTEDRVVCIPEAFLGRPGPRLVEGYRALRAVVERCGGT